MLQLEGKASEVSALASDLEDQNDALGILAELQTHVSNIEQRTSTLESKTNQL